jgi:class 3 adenylate cyclase
LTVLFCDLVGSTALSTRLDPEDMREVITSFQDTCREAIQRYAGFIARYMGDGILVYFGYPQAHEDEAERAVRAGLAIVRSMAQLNADVGKRYEAVLAVRIGVATGSVVVGDIIGEGVARAGGRG